MRNKIYFFSFSICLVIALWTANIVVAQQIPALTKSETTAAENLKIFDAVWSKVNEYYFDPKFNGVDWAKVKETYRPQAEKAVDKNALLLLLRQMLGELKTSHVEVWIAVSEKQLEHKIGENFDSKRDFLLLGAGFDTTTIVGQHVVSKVENNTPAGSAGIAPGWTMTAVNDVPVTNRPLAGVIELAEGKKIHYRFLNNKDKEVDLTLESVFFVRKSSRISRPLGGNNDVGYIKFDGFTAGIAGWMKQEVGKFKGAKALIIDLRDNGGGLRDEVKNSLSPFFAQDAEFGSFVERSGKIREKAVKGSGAGAFAGKVIVLINENTGSGAEIFARLMQENKRAQIVGGSSRGAVLNSRDFDLPENFMLRVAFRDYVSPAGMRLEGSGVKPDIETGLTIEDLRTGRDRVLERAVKMVE